MQRLRRFLLALIVLVPCLYADGPKPRPSEGVTEAKSKPAALTERVAVVGASISAGMGLGRDGNPFDGSRTLSTVIEASLTGKHEPVANHASLMFFTQPEQLGPQSVTAGLKADPTLIVAIDYLFWFGYGSYLKDEAERLALLEKGLKSLEPVTCTLLLGNMPNMKMAVDSPHSMLPAEALPASESLAKMNERITAWARERKHVVLVDSAALVDKVQKGEEIQVGNNRWAPGSAVKLLQADRLHTTLEGTVATWLYAVETLAAARKDFDAKSITRDVKELVTKIDPELGAKVLAQPGKAEAPAKGGGKPKVKKG